MQPWRRWREPLAVVLLVVLAVPLLLGAVVVGTALVSGRSRGLGSVPSGDNLLLLATALAVLWCVTPLPVIDDEPPVADRAAPNPTGQLSATSPHAWPIAVAGVVIIGLTVLGSLAVSVLRLFAIREWPSFPDTGYLALISETVVSIAVPVVSLGAAIMAVRRAAAARSAAAGNSRRALPAADAAKDEEEHVTEPPAPERLPAAWQADEATGAVWLTADDAAQGRPGLSWSEPPAPAATDARGWTPAPTAEPIGPAPSDPGGPQEEAAGPDTRRSATPQPPSAALDDDLH